MSLQRVGVVGFGTMGSGIAQLVATAGFDVLVRDVDQAAIDRGFARVDASLARVAKAGRLGSAQVAAARGRIRGTTSLADFADRDLVIEAVVEVLAEKRRLFAELDAICPQQTIFASNTSSLAIADMASATARADRFAGLHFFNPPVMMPLVEIVQALTTADATIDTLRAFVAGLGHTGVVCRDTAGFVVNRLLMPYLHSAIGLLERGVASAEDIDTAVKLGLRHPMGPFELMDYTGLDVLQHMAEDFFEEFKDPALAPPPLVRRMVQAGRLGVKVGRGFYEYDERGKRRA